MQYNLSPCKPGEADVFRNPWVALGLIRAARSYCLENEIRYGFFLIADSLARILRRVGMEIDACGERCNHRGWRRPYIHDMVTGYRKMKQRCPEIHKMFWRSPAYGLFSDEVDEPAVHWEDSNTQLQLQ